MNSIEYLVSSAASRAYEVDRRSEVSLRRVGSWDQVRIEVRKREEVRDGVGEVDVKRERAWIRGGFCWVRMQPYPLST